MMSFMVKNNIFTRTFLVLSRLKFVAYFDNLDYRSEIAKRIELERSKISIKSIFR